MARMTSSVHEASGLVGPVLSGSFLFVIGVLKLTALVSTVGALAP